MKNKIFLLSLLCIPFMMLGQSISGTMKNHHETALSYGNVTIYQKGEKIASIVTDATGNFKIALDTGYYKIKLQYAGYKPFIKTIHVTGDERDDFNLKDNINYDGPKMKEITLNKTSYSTKPHSYLDKSSDMAIKEVAPLISKRGSVSGRSIMHTPKPNRNVNVGLLTAGEVNDFTKWEMWQDITSGVLSTYQKTWQLFLQQRYTIQLSNLDDFPIVNATVELVDKNGATQFIARTDNTGKAELWGKIRLTDQQEGAMSANIIIKERTFSINKLKPFKEGINTLRIAADCEQPQLVQIAFVVDATGSMSDEIDFLKAELSNIIYQTKNKFPALSFNYANVFYRDRTDVYLTRTQEFTEVLSLATQFINQQGASGGGDRPEAVDVALNTALDSLSWNNKARSRILFLVLDAPPHQNPEVLEKLSLIIKKAAKKGVRIVPIASSGLQKAGEYLLRNIALGTNGTYVFLTDDSGIGRSHIKPTTDNYNVETLNELLIRLISTYTLSPNCEQPNIAENLLDSITKSKDEIKWKIYPNPTQDKTKIKITEDVEYVYLTDLTGKILQRFQNIEKNRAFTVNLTRFPKGIYLITFTKDEKKFTKKVIRI